MADRFGTGLEGHSGNGGHGDEPGRLGTDTARPAAQGGTAGGVAHSDGDGRDQGWSGEPAPQCDGVDGNMPWDDSVWFPCRDGKYRRIPTQSLLQCVADGLSERVGPCWDDGFTKDEADRILQASKGFPLAPKTPHRAVILKGMGNAIVPQVAATFVRAWMDVSEDFASQWGAHLENHDIL